MYIFYIYIIFIMLIMLFNDSSVRQGCILSPCLFNIYTEYLIREALED